MSDGTSIEWTHMPGYLPATWNPTRGCSRVSEGCRNCYAEIMAARFSKPGQWGEGFAEMRGGDHRWTGRVELVEDKLLMPLKWRLPRCIFVNSTSDLFHERLPDEAIDRVIAVMALCPQHRFLVLTKRPERMRQYMTTEVRGQWSGKAYVVEGGEGQLRPMTDVRFRMMSVLCDMLSRAPSQAINRASEWQDAHYPGGDGLVRKWPLPNVWLGASVEDQPMADERIPHLLATPAAVRFVSYEPALGPVDFQLGGERAGRLDWVIAGGESGPGARPAHPDWFRSVRDQCAAAGVAFFIDHRP